MIHTLLVVMTIAAIVEMVGFALCAVGANIKYTRSRHLFVTVGSIICGICGTVILLAMSVGFVEYTILYVL